MASTVSAPGGSKATSIVRLVRKRMVTVPDRPSAVTTPSAAPPGSMETLSTRPTPAGAPPRPDTGTAPRASPPVDAARLGRRADEPAAAPAAKRELQPRLAHGHDAMLRLDAELRRPIDYAHRRRLDRPRQRRNGQGEGEPSHVRARRAGG